MTGESFAVVVNVVRETDDEDNSETSFGSVVCSRYPAEKTESWWLVVGDIASNSMLSIKRFTLGKSAKVSVTAFTLNNER